MVEHHHLVGEVLGEIDHLGDLRMVHPAIVAEAELAQLREALAPGLVVHQPVRGIGTGAAHAKIGIPAGREADTGEAPASRLHLCLQHVAHRRADAQFGVTDDAVAGFGLAVLARRAHGCDAIHELDLAHRLHRLGPVLAKHRAALDEHGAHDIMALVAIGQQVGQQIAVGRPLPQMMVRIDDRQIGLERRLFRLGHPGKIGVQHVAEFRHGSFSHCFLRFVFLREPPIRKQADP